MKIDLHIHTIHSDGALGMSLSDLPMFSSYELVAITDHEHLFNPTAIHMCDSTKLISGVEICCNFRNQPIEILGYNFDAKNCALVDLVDKVKNLRISAITNIMSANGFGSNDLPENPFRMHVRFPEGVDAREFWKQHNYEYRTICHSVPATDVISTIINAGGIPVLAHPMESLVNKSERDVEHFILSLGISTVELITPKHNSADIALVKRIVERNYLSASIGSDSHNSPLTEILHDYNIEERSFDWIRNLVFS